MLWKDLKVLVSQSHNWVSMANDSLNFIVFPVGQSGGTLRQPNYNPRWGGRPWARIHNCLNFLILCKLSQGHDTDTNHTRPVRQCSSQELIMLCTLAQIISSYFFSYKTNLMIFSLVYCRVINKIDLLAKHIHYNTFEFPVLPS